MPPTNTYDQQQIQGPFAAFSISRPTAATPAVQWWFVALGALFVVYATAVPAAYLIIRCSARKKTNITKKEADKVSNGACRREAKGGNTLQHSAVKNTCTFTSSTGDDLAFTTGAAKALARATIRSFTSSMPSGTVWAVCAVVGAAIAVAIAIVGAAFADSFEQVTAADLVVFEYRYAANSSIGNIAEGALNSADLVFSACPPTTSFYKHSTNNKSVGYLDATNTHNNGNIARPFRMLRVGADGVLRRAEVVEGIANINNEHGSASFTAASVVAPLSQWVLSTLRIGPLWRCPKTQPPRSPRLLFNNCGPRRSAAICPSRIPFLIRYGASPG